MTQNLKDHLRREGPKLLAMPLDQRKPEAIMGATVGEDELWACTACMACEEACPVYVEQVIRNIDLRRYLVLVETKYSSEVRLTLKNLEKSGNPWGSPRGTRAEWHIPLNRVPLLMIRPYVVTIHDMASLLFEEDRSNFRTNEVHV